MYQNLSEEEKEKQQKYVRQSYMKLFMKKMKNRKRQYECEY